MFSKSKYEKTTFGIIGLGRFGMALALELAQSGEEIIAIDHDEEKVREIREYTENAFIVHNLDKNTLTETGIQNCEVVIVCIGEKLDTSILTTLNLVSLGIKRVIAKANSTEHGIILKKLGAEVVYPEHDRAIRLAANLKSGNIIDFVQLGKRINVTKIIIPNCIIGKSVIETNLRGKFGLNIIAVENGGEVIQTVKPDYVFRAEDTIYLSGETEGFNKFAEWLEENC